MQKPTLSTALNLFDDNAPLTMSSLEIAKLMGKDHKNVLADVRAMLEGLEIDTAEFSAVYKADNKQTYECFNRGNGRYAPLAFNGGLRDATWHPLTYWTGTKRPLLN